MNGQPSTRQLLTRPPMTRVGRSVLFHGLSAGINTAWLQFGFSTARTSAAMDFADLPMQKIRSRRCCVRFIRQSFQPQKVSCSGWGLTVCLLLAALVAGCRSETPTAETKTGTPDTLHSEIERGPVKVDIDILPKEPRLSDEPTLTLTITAESGVEVTMPPFGQSMGDFIIRDFYEPLAKTDNGKQILQQVYTLEPTLAGLSIINPIEINFVDNRTNGDGKPHRVETEAIKLEIATMIGSEAPSLDQLRPVEAPIELPDDSPNSLLLWAFGIIAGLILIGVAVWLMTRRRKPVEPELTPQQLAWRELNELIASKLSETDVKEYFVQLTGVVRRYIERSTAVNAPELTTEEFLRHVSRQKIFSEEEDRRLGVFLESADLVKFAGYQPDEEIIKQSTHKAKQFIELKTNRLDASKTAEPASTGSQASAGQASASSKASTRSQNADIDADIDAGSNAGSEIDRIPSGSNGSSKSEAGP